MLAHTACVTPGKPLAGKRQRLLVAPLLKVAQSQTCTPPKELRPLSRGSKVNCGGTVDAQMVSPPVTPVECRLPVAQVAQSASHSVHTPANAAVCADAASQHSIPHTADRKPTVHAPSRPALLKQKELLSTKANSLANPVAPCPKPDSARTAVADATPQSTPPPATQHSPEVSMMSTLQIPAQLTHADHYLFNLSHQRLVGDTQSKGQCQTHEPFAKSAPKLCQPSQPVGNLSRCPDTEQRGVHQLLAVQRLPAVLSSSMPAVKDLATGIKLPSADTLMGKNQA